MPLQRAHNPEMVELLLSKGAKVDIFSACKLGRIDDVKRLLMSDPSVVHARLVRDITPPEVGPRIQAP